MAPRRLSDRDKDQIVQLYQQKGMTLAVLAEQFGVSASTVGRVVRQASPPTGVMQAELLPSVAAPAPAPKGKTPVVTKALPQPLAQKSPAAQDGGPDAIAPISNGSGSSPSPVGTPTPRAQGGPTPKRTRRRSRAGTELEAEGGGPVEAAIAPDITPDPAPVAPEVSVPPEASDTRDRPQRRSRRSSSGGGAGAGGPSPTPPEAPAPPPPPPVTEPPEPPEPSKIISKTSPSPKVSPKTIVKAADRTPTPGRAPRAIAEADTYNDTLDDDGDLDLLEDGEDFDDALNDEDDDDGDDDDDLGRSLGIIARANATEPIEIYPLTAASIPNPCYLVVDRAANLVVRPLKDFRELGAIPDGEGDCNTLPVFDNHRVARRFSGRTQRVIKVPDSSIFAKATVHLQEKDITRLLIDGQVYAL